MPTPLSFLSLGDSYTIGEAVLLIENFPYQTVQLLRKEGLAVQGPEIIAKTGWTTDELLSAMNDYRFAESYDIVTLLIGVNNQYRGRSEKDFAADYEVLLSKAIQLAGNNPSHVFVLSIPDWGITPFAEGRDRAMIAKEIDSFNSLKKAITEKKGVSFIDTTTGARQDRNSKEWVAADGLHPAAREYAVWTQQLSELILKQLK